MDSDAGLMHLDTKYYWNLTPHIFRYGHTGGAGGGKLTSGVHTVNEGSVDVSCVLSNTLLMFSLLSFAGYELRRDDQVLHHSDPQCGRIFSSMR